MTNSIKDLPEQLAGYSQLTQQKLNEYQTYLKQQADVDEPDMDKISRAIGGIYTIAMYEHYLDTITDEYGFISREFLAQEYDIDLDEAEFDEWVEEQQEWFIESRNLPASPATFPCLMNWLDDFYTNELLLPDSTLNLQAQENAALEYPDYNPDEMRSGMLTHLQWIKDTLVPALMPAEWQQKGTPVVYQNIAGGIKRHLN